MNTYLLAYRYVCFHRGKALLLAGSLALVIFLPVAISWLTSRFQEELVRRATSTPLIVGKKGSRYDLTLAALYFEGRPLDALPASTTSRVEENGDARAIPLFIKHRAQGAPIVGTTLDYFDFRKLHPEQGQLFARLGDCVLGANVARRLHLAPGEFLLSDPGNVFDLAGNYPLKLRVVGTLGRGFTPDDDAVFVDLKTAWIIEGIGHGHQDVAQADPSLLLDKSKEKIVASAAVTSYTEITDANLDSFHFHGDPDNFPLSAVLAVPDDDRAGALLMGRFLAPQETLQILRPTEVIREMFNVIFRVKKFFDMQSIMVAVATALLLGLIVLLSVRLRARELETLFKIGCARGTAIWMLAWEWVIVSAGALVLVAFLAALTVLYAQALLRLLLFA